MKSSIFFLMCVLGLIVQTSSAQHRVEQPPHPPVEAFTEIPIQSYALVDISGAGQNADWIALNDSNEAAFAYTSSDGSTFTTKRWVNGLVSDGQVITPLQAVSDYHTTAYGTELDVHRTITYQPMVLLASGRVYGTVFLYYDYGFWPPDWYSLAFFASSGSVVLFNAGDFPPTIIDAPYYQSPSHLGASAWAANETGYSAGGRSIYLSQNLLAQPPGYFSVLSWGLNDNGWVLGDTGNVNGNFTYGVWNGSGVISLPGDFYPAAINNNNQIVGQIGFYDANGNPTQPKDAYLWKNGTTKYFRELLDKPGFRQWRTQIKELEPRFISNASPVDQSVTVLFVARTKEGPESGNWVERTFTLTLDSNDNPLRLAALQLPAGLTGWDLQAQNANGILAATGVADASTSDSHAFLLVPMQTTFYKPTTSSDAQWQSADFIQPWEQLYRFDGNEKEDCKFKVRFSGLSLVQDAVNKIDVQIAAYSPAASSPNYHVYNLGSGNLSPDGKEVWCTIANQTLTDTYLPQDHYNTTCFASFDWCDGTTASSYKDSDIFDAAVPALTTASQKQVVARGRGNPDTGPRNDGTFGNIPALSAEANRSFLIEGGAQVIEVAGNHALFRAQADWLYLSTHGWHSGGSGYPSGVLETVTLSSAPPPNREYVSPEEVHWDINTKVVIIAGCSVLDIGDFNNNYVGTQHNDSPGKRWEQTGPQILLGYAAGAPADIPNGIAIVKSWSNYRKTHDEITSWQMATKDNNAVNACAIKKGDYYGYFTYIKIPNPLNSFKYAYLGETWTTVPKSAW